MSINKLKDCTCTWKRAYELAMLLKKGAVSLGKEKQEMEYSHPCLDCHEDDNVRADRKRNPHPYIKETDEDRKL